MSGMPQVIKEPKESTTSIVQPCLQKCLVPPELVIGCQNTEQLEVFFFQYISKQHSPEETECISKRETILYEVFILEQTGKVRVFAKEGVLGSCTVLEKEGDLSWFC